MERLVLPELVGDVAGRMVGVSCSVDLTAASLGRCRVTRELPLPDAREREHCSMAGWLKLAVRWPDVPVHDARRADPFFFGDDEPRPPGDDWLHIVGRLHSASTFSGSAGSLWGLPSELATARAGQDPRAARLCTCAPGPRFPLRPLGQDATTRVKAASTGFAGGTLCEEVDVRLRRASRRSRAGRAITGAPDASGRQLRSRWTDGAPRRGSR